MIGFVDGGLGQQVNYICMPVIDYMPVILFIDSTSRANSCMIGLKKVRL